MEKILNEIVLGSTSTELNSILKRDYSKSRSISRHYNQNEEFFIKLEQPFIIPPFPIHHEVTKLTPEKEYIEALKELLEQVILSAPAVFSNTTYFFDPAEIFHPCFYQIFKYTGQLYLYLMRLDLTFKPNDGEIIERGSNDTTNRYKTTKLFMECDLIPLKNILTDEKGINKFIIEQNISQTWIGETGRGYFIEGIWIDTELTKFLSKLFLPEGKRTYPYYPFTCKYRTLCHSLIDLSPDGRKKHLIYLHKAREIVLPVIENIQKALKQQTFSPDIPEFIEMKRKVPPYWQKVWENLSVRSYLNDLDMKEFTVEI